MPNAKASLKRTKVAKRQHPVATIEGPPALLTADQARESLSERGISIAEFARQNGLSYGTVYQVLSGLKKGRFGDAHRAAVLLGMKRGVVLPRA
jgi:gp16 family phage-associated protein